MSMLKKRGAMTREKFEEGNEQGEKMEEDLSLIELSYVEQGYEQG
jgi:hypothetical protein